MEQINLLQENTPVELSTEAGPDNYLSSDNFLEDYKGILPELDETLISFKSNIDEAIKTVKKENPAFKNLSLAQLKENLAFQKSLKEYMTKNPPIQPEIQDTIKTLKSILPKIHVKPNNKLANKITKELVDSREIELIVSNKKSKKEVATKVIFDYENKNVQMSSRFKFTPYDREVYDGVITLYEAGNNTVTPIMVYRAMNGLTDTEYVKPEALTKIKESLDKSSRIRTIIDFTDEAKLYNKNIEKTIYEGYLLASEKVTVKISGNEQEAYKLLRSPILYEYAQISRQIISVPINLLNTKDTVYSTDEVIVIRGYLLRQIEWMKSDNSERNTSIAYQGIYEELDIEQVNSSSEDYQAYKDKTLKIRNHVKAILKSWQAQDYLKKFEEYKDGRQIKGIRIYF
jgi:hypothetical protein